jgi:hypothetical protein
MAKKKKPKDKCFICGRDIDQAVDFVPLLYMGRKGEKTVLACITHKGVKEEFDRQNPSGTN